jgi:myo-inositol 2-dehydrogenase / D-chiro-inositol 1-dehydrogenase
MKKVALFGAGRMGHIHAANLAALPGIELIAICDQVEQAAQQLAQKHGAKVASADQVFSDRDIEAVVICSPTSTHSALIIRAAQSGKNIFCEKPVDLSTARALECAKAVKIANVACMIGFQRRFDPTFQEAAKRLQRGDIGKPEMLVITSRDTKPPPVEYVQSSGGIFRDMLIHDFDIFRWILCGDGDEAAWLIANGSCLVDPGIAAVGDLDCTVVTIKTQRGRLCQINTTRRTTYGYDQRFEVQGSLGMLSCGNVRPSQVLQADANGMRMDNPELFFLERYRDAYRLEMEHFFTQLQSGEPFRTTIEDGIKAQQIADAASESAKSGNPITF